MTSSESMEVDQTDGPAWSELPSPAVENVYSFLKRRDRTSMSLVCRNWHQEYYSSPCLWRKMKFHFHDCKHETEMCPDVKFAQRFGAWFHYVKIVHTSIKDVEPSKAMSQLKLFLEALACQSQLLSISFKGMGYYLASQNDEFKADVYRMILNFTKSQKRLKSFEIYVGFRYDQEILKALFVNNYKTLRYLHIPTRTLQPLYESDFTVDDDLIFVVFMNLEVLEIDCTPMFERMMSSFYEYRNKVDTRRKKGRLKELSLYNNCAKIDNEIPLHIWKYIREIFPNLKINLFLFSVNAAWPFSSFVVSEMPLRFLHFSHLPNPGRDNEVGRLLRHIASCKIRFSLEVLSISTSDDSSTINFDPDLITLTNACPELKSLYFYLSLPVLGLDTVFNSWLENRPVSLRTVEIEIVIREPIAQEEKMIYRSLSELLKRISPLLQPLEILLTVLY